MMCSCCNIGIAHLKQCVLLIVRSKLWSNKQKHSIIMFLVPLCLDLNSKRKHVHDHRRELVIFFVEVLVHLGEIGEAEVLLKSKLMQINHLSPILFNYQAIFLCMRIIE